MEETYRKPKGGKSEEINANGLIGKADTTQKLSSKMQCENHMFQVMLAKICLLISYHISC